MVKGQVEPLIFSLYQAKIVNQKTNSCMELKWLVLPSKIWLNTSVLLLWKNKQTNKKQIIGLWPMTIVYHKVNHTTAVRSLLKQVNMASGSWYAASDLVNAFFPIPINKEGQRKFTIKWEGQNTFNFLTQACQSSCYFTQDLDFLDILWNIILVMT